MDNSQDFANTLADQAKELATIPSDSPEFCLGVASILDTIEKMMVYRHQPDLARVLTPVRETLLRNVEVARQEPRDVSIWTDGHIELPERDEFRRLVGYQPIALVRR